MKLRVKRGDNLKMNTIGSDKYRRMDRRYFMGLKKIFAIGFSMTLMAGLFTGCGSDTSSANGTSSAESADSIAADSSSLASDSASDTDSSDKINVVATTFPEYDFLRQIGGDNIELTLLLKPGAEVHSFEPTPEDIKNVIASDIFVYVGGDSDEWVKSITDEIDTDKTEVVTLMDCVTTVEEEVTEEMTPESDEGASDDEEAEYDEHVWTSPKNAELICNKLCDALCTKDPDNSDSYKANLESYTGELEKLDSEFRDVVDNAARKEIIVGDRFPFRYFCDEYGLTYYAAFPGCSSDSEPSAQTIAFLVDKVTSDEIPVVFYKDLSNGKVCEAICEQTGAKAECLYSCESISKDDFDAGLTYIDLMSKNVDVLKEALN